MELKGGCYCGKIRYKATGAPRLKAQCHCRECQYISGGGPNYFMLMPKDGFSYENGMPKVFKRGDIDNAVTREFCADCGTHLVSKRQGLEEVVLKIGTLDNPSLFEAPQIAIFTVDEQPFHEIPDGMPAFKQLPPQ